MFKDARNGYFSENGCELKIRKQIPNSSKTSCPLAENGAMTKRVLDMTETSIHDLPDDALRVIFQWMGQDSGSDSVHTTVQLVGSIPHKEYSYTAFAATVQSATPDRCGGILYDGSVWLPSLVCKRFRTISEEFRRDWLSTPLYVNKGCSAMVVKVVVHNFFGRGQHCLYTLQSKMLYGYGYGRFHFGVSIYLGPEKGHVQIMSDIQLTGDKALSFYDAYFAVYHAVRRYLLTGYAQNMTLSSKMNYNQAQSALHYFATRGFK